MQKQGYFKKKENYYYSYNGFKTNQLLMNEIDINTHYMFNASQ